MDAEALVRPVIEAAGLELVEVGMRRDGGRRVLRVVVDHERGVDLDTIAEVAEKVSGRLDREGFDIGPYALEVSSPGIERALRRPEHFRRVLGRQVKVTTAPTAGSKVATGALVAADDEAIVIGAEEGELRVPHADIASARTVVDWDAELKRSHA